MAANLSTNQSLGGHISSGLRSLFYLITPAESAVETVDEVPKYVDKAVPFFMMAIALEMVLLVMQGRRKSLPRWDDSYSSLSAGIISLLPLLLMRNIEGSAYMYIYEHCRLYELPWDSAWTWWLTMLGVDLGYYWVHRMSHEINFMWAAHQVHHSSEEYNLTTALRQSVLQRYSSWVFYLPMAFFIPPSVFIVHIQLNLLYQFWIHTEAVRRLGPLEWIINTPSHHRVHHGRNRYCIDKNYAGVLIIWDRMFSTFQEEKEDDIIAYGLVHPLESWDPVHTQLCHWKYIIQTAWNTEGVSDRLRVFFYGPGWQPGKPRLGLEEDLPDIHGPQPKYSTRIPVWLNIYAWLHFALAALANGILASQREVLSGVVMGVCVMFVFWTMINIGLFYEQKWYSGLAELARCVVYVSLDSLLFSGATHSILYFTRLVFYVSTGLWLLQTARSLQTKIKTA